MKDWLKNNAVGIIFGIFGSIGFIGSVAAKVQDMAAAYANVFWWWTAATALLGIAAGAFASGLGKRKSEDRLASVREAKKTKCEEEYEKKQKDQRETQAFMKLDFEVKAFLCLLYDNGSLELEELYGDVDPNVLRRYVNEETTPVGVRYRLVSWAREFLEKHEELLRDAHAWIEEVLGPKIDDGCSIVEE